MRLSDINEDIFYSLTEIKDTLVNPAERILPVLVRCEDDLTDSVYEAVKELVVEDRVVKQNSTDLTDNFCFIGCIRYSFLIISRSTVTYRIEDFSG